MSSIDSDLMIDFARRWAKYGGGSAADIFVHFGVSEKVFFERLGGIMAQRVDIPSIERAEISSICRRRLEPKKHSAERTSVGAVTSRRRGASGS